jgi:hypothetical protein
MKKEFTDNTNVAVFTTKHILNDNSPILYIYHDEDGAWQFFGNEDATEENARLVCLADMIEIDNSILEIAYMPMGYYAYRADKKSEWKIEKQ